MTIEFVAPEWPRILLVDDDPPVGSSLRRCLRQLLDTQVAIEVCTSGREAIERLHALRVDVLVSDLWMPGIGGMELLARAAEIQPECVRLLLTAAPDFASAQRAVNQVGVFRYLTKPWREPELRSHLLDALAHGRAMRAQRDHALAWSVSRGQASAEELERRRLEALEPGITKVEWDADGSILMPQLDSAGC